MSSSSRRITGLGTTTLGSVDNCHFEQDLCGSFTVCGRVIAWPETGVYVPVYRVTVLGLTPFMHVVRGHVTVVKIVVGTIQLVDVPRSVNVPMISDNGRRVLRRRDRQCGDSRVQHGERYGWVDGRRSDRCTGATPPEPYAVEHRTLVTSERVYVFVVGLPALARPP
jgi:hypothetical protein